MMVVSRRLRITSVSIARQFLDLFIYLLVVGPSSLSLGHCVPRSQQCILNYTCTIRIVPFQQVVKTVTISFLPAAEYQARHHRHDNKLSKA